MRRLKEPAVVLLDDQGQPLPEMKFPLHLEPGQILVFADYMSALETWDEEVEFPPVRIGINFPHTFHEKQVFVETLRSAIRQTGSLSNAGFTVLADEESFTAPQQGYKLPDISASTEGNPLLRRIAIVFDGYAWFLRHIHTVEHDLTCDEMVYHCDKPLGGPFPSLEEVIEALEIWLESIVKKNLT